MSGDRSRSSRNAVKPRGSRVRGGRVLLERWDAPLDGTGQEPQVKIQSTGGEEQRAKDWRAGGAVGQEQGVFRAGAWGRQDPPGREGCESGLSLQNGLGDALGGEPGTGGAGSTACLSSTGRSCWGPETPPEVCRDWCKSGTSVP